jgi:putative inorganic carbon (HCO3(-)) transporter
MSTSDRLEQAGLVAVFGFATALQFSIFVAQTLLAIAILCWIALIVTNRERVTAPRFFVPLAIYAALTVVSALFSADRGRSLLDTKQLVLFLIVPLIYRFTSGERGSTLITWIVSAGAVSAAAGIVEYGLFGYDHLGSRPKGLLGHYMTYSGLLMLVISAALARTLFGQRDRLWAALVMPALAVAIAFTFTRSAAAGACAAAAVLLTLKNFRLLALLPIIAAIFFMAAPGAVTQRFISTFDLKDPTRRDRMAMLREGTHMVRDHPIFGVGPNMVQALYVQYRDPSAVEAVNPHLHNVPLQIAAERGLPALGVWLWFLVVLVLDLSRIVRLPSSRMLAATALAAVVAMLTAGLFEYNFGDSEFLMLFLVLITLPFAATRAGGREAAVAAAA